MLQSKTLNKQCLQFSQKDYSACRVLYHNSLSVMEIKHGNGRLAAAVSSTIYESWSKKWSATQWPERVKTSQGYSLQRRRSILQLALKCQNTNVDYSDGNLCLEFFKTTTTTSIFNLLTQLDVGSFVSSSRDQHGSMLIIKIVNDVYKGNIDIVTTHISLVVFSRFAKVNGQLIVKMLVILANGYICISTIYCIIY